MFALTSSILGSSIVFPAQASQNLPRFDPQQAIELLAPGGATIKGRPYAIASGGLINRKKAYPSNKVVYLFPMTTYLKAWHDEYRKDPNIGRYHLSPEVSQYCAQALTDEEGYFQIRGLKPGRYMLFTEFPYTAKVRQRYDTGRTRTTGQVFSDWSVELTTSPIYRTRKVRTDLTRTIFRVVEIKQDRTTVDLGEFRD